MHVGRAERVCRADVMANNLRSRTGAARAARIPLVGGSARLDVRRGRQRKHHPNPCEAWGRKARLGDETWEAPVLAQVAGIALGEDTMASIVGALGSGRRPVALDKARIERQIRELALEHAAGRLEDEAYLARLKVLRSSGTRSPSGRPPGYRPSGASSGSAPSASRSKPRRSPKEKADLMHAIYDRITVAGPEIVGVRLTPGGLRARIGAGTARKG